MAEDFKIKAVEGVEVPTEQSVEETVLEKAAESGEISPEAAGKEPDDGVYRVNLDDLNKPEDAVQERETEGLDVGQQARDGEEVDEGVREQPSEETDRSEDSTGSTESPIEIIEDEPVDDVVSEQQVSTDESIPANNQESPELPEGIDKLVDFMKETGGTLEDYLHLNRDLENMGGVDLLREKYKVENPDLTEEEVGFLLEEDFGYDPEEADERTIKKKQIAFKKAVSDAKKDLKSMKEKYYEDLKYSRSPKLTDEAKEAILAYEKQQEQAKLSKQRSEDLAKKSDEYFNDFKGFEFKLGDKRVRYKVTDPSKVKQQNADLSHFMSSFSDENGNVTKPDVYHKTLYAAQNIDRIAQHFYDQGRADAVKENAKKAKNIDMGARQDASSVQTSDGTKVRVVSGDDSGKLRLKLRQYR